MSHENLGPLLQVSLYLKFQEQTDYADQVSSEQNTTKMSYLVSTGAREEIDVVNFKWFHAQRALAKNKNI